MSIGGTEVPVGAYHIMLMPADCSAEMFLFNAFFCFFFLMQLTCFIPEAILQTRHARSWTKAKKGGLDLDEHLGTMHETAYPPFLCRASPRIASRMYIRLSHSLRLFFALGTLRGALHLSKFQYSLAVLGKIKTPFGDPISASHPKSDRGQR